MMDYRQTKVAFTSLKTLSWAVLLLMAIAIVFTAWQSIRNWEFIAV